MAEYEAARERGEDVSAPPPMPYDRAAQERRAERAEKRPRRCSARSTRWRWRSSRRWRSGYQFLSTQLEDLKTTRVTC